MSTSAFKVVLLGEGRVGKTTIVSRFVNDKCSDTGVSTVQASMYCKKKVDLGENRGSVDLSVWDTAGQERFHALGPIYYRNANGAVLVYDITDAETFEKVKMWLKELRKVVGDSICIVICGNKADMEKQRDMDSAVAEQYAKQQGALHFNTSAKLGTNVIEAFAALAEKIVQSQPASLQSPTTSGSMGSFGGTAGTGGKPRKKAGLRIDSDEGSSTGAATSATTTDSTRDAYDGALKASSESQTITAQRKSTMVTLSAPKQEGPSSASGGDKTTGGKQEQKAVAQKKSGCCD